MKSLENFIDSNSSLEKLLIHHNNYGPESMNQLADVLERNSKIKYLDVSANEILT